MAKLRSFKLSDEADKVLIGIKERTGESYTGIVEKGIYYYAKQLQKEAKKNTAPKTLLDVTEDMIEDPNPLDVPFTLDVSRLNTYDGKQRKRWTKSDVKQLLKMRDDGKTIKEICSYLDRPETSVRKKLWEMK